LNDNEPLLENAWYIKILWFILTIAAFVMPFAWVYLTLRDIIQK